MTVYEFDEVALFDQYAGGLQLARGAQFTVTNPATGDVAPDLTQDGQPVAVVTTTNSGTAAWTSTMGRLRITSPRGLSRIVYSVGILDEALAAPAAAADSAASAAASAQSAQDAANLVGAPAKSAMDAAMGGDVAGLVPAVERKIRTTAGLNKTILSPGGIEVRASNATGSLVIDTPITFGNYMTTVTIKGFHFLANKTDIHLTAGAYFYSVGPSIPYGSQSNLGQADVTLRFARKVSTGTVSIILDIPGGVWQIPKVVVERVEIGYTTPPDSFSSGWTGNLMTDLSGYDLVTTPTRQSILDKAPTVHTHTASQISDSTTTGRAVVKATDAAAARAALGVAPQPAFYPGTAVPSPWIIAHRGGDSLYPEESMPGWDAAARDGFALEADAQQLSDGTWVCIHDSTVDRTMTGVTGNVSALTPTQWAAARIKPTVAGGKTARPVFLDDLLARHGGRSPLVIECKAGDVNSLITRIKAHGLEQAVVMQAFTYTDATAMAAAGLPTMLLLDSTITPTAATIAAAGIKYVGVSTSMSAANISALTAAGLKVVVWTVNTRAGLSTALANGAVGVFSDDPWYVANRIDYRAGLSVADGAGWPGMRPLIAPSTAWAGPTLTDVGVEACDYAVSGQTAMRSVDAPQLGLLTRGTFYVSLRAHFYPEAVGQTSTLGFYLWRNTSNDEAAYVDGAAAGQDGFTVVIRRNGTISVYKYVAGAAASLIGATTASGEFAPAGKAGVIDVRVRFTPTQIIVDASNGTSITLSDTFTVPNMRLGLRWVGTDGQLSNVRAVQQ